MSGMTIVRLVILVLAVCLSAQQVASNNTTAQSWNSTSNATTMAPETYSTNSTSPTGAGVSLHPDHFSFLLPVVMAASLLQSYC